MEVFKNQVEDTVITHHHHHHKLFRKRFVVWVRQWLIK